MEDRSKHSYSSKDGEILLDDKSEPAQTDTSNQVHDEAEISAEAAVPDDAQEFPPINVDGDVADVPWVM